MSCFLSRTGICGDSRGISGFFNLLQCNESIEIHLASVHLSRENITEGELILARAGLFDLEETVVEQMSVCAKHRHTFGKFWRPKTACQYPAHQGRPGRNQKGAKSRYSVNLQMSKAIQQMYGVLVQIGSGAYMVVTSLCLFSYHDKISYSKLAFNGGEELQAPVEFFWD